MLGASATSWTKKSDPIDGSIFTALCVENGSGKCRMMLRRQGHSSRCDREKFVDATDSFLQKYTRLRKPLGYAINELDYHTKKENKIHKLFSNFCDLFLNVLGIDVDEE